MSKSYYCFLFLITLFFSCDNNDIKTDSKAKTREEKWYDDTKATILEQSDIKPDSVIYIVNNQETNYKRQYTYSKGCNFIERAFRKDKIVFEKYYNTVGDFELRREICDNGTYGFEGIFYKGYPYGISTWRNCDGKIDHQGVRFKDKRIGEWREWKGEVIIGTYYGNKEMLDSMPQINK